MGFRFGQTDEDGDDGSMIHEAKYLKEETNYKETKKCTCSTCGYQWVHGYDGSHSCVQAMQKTINMLISENSKLEVKVKDLTNEIIFMMESH